MAVPAKKVTGNTPEDINKTEDTTPLPDVPPTEAIKNDVTENDLVEVKTIQNHKCTVGGKSYLFKAGQRVLVPFNVKCILSRAGLLRG